MGAGNYYFSAPAGDSWNKMVYVDLQPCYWSDEQDRRRSEFDEFIKNDADSKATLLAASEDGRALVLEGLFKDWQDEHYAWPSDERSFYDDQNEQQHEDIFAALESAFPGVIERPDRHSDTIADATVVGEIGRMALARAYTYYGDRMALIVTPRAELQDIVWSLENGGFEFERGWDKWRLSAMRAENSRLAGLKRSVESGALFREMESTFQKVLRALHEFGLAKQMTFRGCAWTSSLYEGSTQFKHIERQVARHHKVRTSIGKALH
jgi:hypothetical protein